MCNKIIRDVIADLYKAIHDSSVEIISNDLPVIKGRLTELKQLFQNLVINAIKFRKKDVSLQIKISVERTGNYWHFTVADNGIGIASYTSKGSLLFSSGFIPTQNTPVRASGYLIAKK